MADFKKKRLFKISLFNYTLVFKPAIGSLPAVGPVNKKKFIIKPFSNTYTGDSCKLATSKSFKPFNTSTNQGEIK